jgi:hypothetical protein
MQENKAMRGDGGGRRRRREANVPTHRHEGKVLRVKK